MNRRIERSQPMKIPPAAALIAFILACLLPAPDCGASPQGAKGIPVLPLPKGLAITVYKAKQPAGTLIVRIENHSASRVKFLPDSIFNPNIQIALPGPDKNSEEMCFMSREMNAGGDSIDSAKSGKQVQVLAPGDAAEFSLKIADIIKGLDPKVKAKLDKAKIALSFDNLVVGVDANDHPEKMFETTFEAPECDLSK
jgi:hypothetical protein